MDMKCSMHVGGKWSVKHNLRDYDPDKWNKDEHIDEERKELNNVLTYTEYREFIDETFGDALMAFNENQRKKHPERLIGFDSGKAYDRTPPEKRRSKAVSAYAREHRKDVQEIIIQLGDHDEYKAMVAEHGQEQADKLYRDYLKECYDKWLKDNSTFKPFCAVIHMDEVRDGTPHLHLTYLATASSSRGLRTKVSVEGALSALDYKRKKDQLYEESPYRRWLKDTRKAYEDFAQEYVDRHDLGIKILPSDKSVVHHQEPPAYKEKKAVKAAQEQLQQLQKKNLDLTTSNDELTFDNNDLTEQNEQLTTDNKALTEQKEQLTTDNQTLTEQKEQLTTDNKALTEQKEQLAADVEQLTAKKSEGLKAVVGAFKAKKTRRAAQKVIDNAEDITKALTEEAEKDRQATASAKKQAEEHARRMRLAQEQAEEERVAVAKERATLNARNEQLDREVDKQVGERTAEYKKALDEEKKDHQRDNKVANRIIEQLKADNDKLYDKLYPPEEEEEKVLDLTGGYDRGY